METTGNWKWIRYKISWRTPIVKWEGRGWMIQKESRKDIREHSRIQHPTSEFSIEETSRKTSAASKSPSEEYKRRKSKRTSPQEKHHVNNPLQSQRIPESVPDKLEDFPLDNDNYDNHNSFNGNNPVNKYKNKRINQLKSCPNRKWMRYWEWRMGAGVI